MRKRLLPLVFAALSAMFQLSRAQTDAGGEILLEAEAFAQIGGWVIDPQFMDNMGSPYLLAHGLGRPVADAQTTVTVPTAGRYRVLVRTKDWVGTRTLPPRWPHFFSEAN